MLPFHLDVDWRSLFGGIVRATVQDRPEIDLAIDEQLLRLGVRLPPDDLGLGACRTSPKARSMSRGYSSIHRRRSSAMSAASMLTSGLPPGKVRLPGNFFQVEDISPVHRVDFSSYVSVL